MPRIVPFVSATALAAGLLISAAPARAQMETREAIALQNQILELRRDLQALRTQGGSGGGGGAYRQPYQGPSAGGGGGSGEMVAQLLDRVNTLEDEIRRLRGRIDEVDNARQTRDAELSKQLGDLTFRLQNGAGPPPAGTAGPTALAPALSPPPSSLGGAPGTPATPARRTPELILQEGNAALGRRDYAAAEAAAREALAQPRTPRSTDAQFLLAQALSGQRNFGQAAIAYDDTFKRSPSGSHAPDALLGLASSLTGMGAKREACEALDEFRTRFPNPRPDLRDGAVATRQRAGCR